MNFKISQKTKNCFQYNKSKNFRTKIEINSQNFYKEHPDLAPRNVYLRTGRIMKIEDVRKVLHTWDKPWWVKCLDKIKNLFKK